MKKNNETAVEVAKTNCHANRCKKIELRARPIQELQGPFDIVISNIPIETHLELTREYSCLLSRSGTLILSGLLGNQRSPIEETLQSISLGIEGTRFLQEWMCITSIRIPDLK